MQLYQLSFILESSCYELCSIENELWKIKIHIHKIYKIVSNARLCFDEETAAFRPVYMKRSLQRKIPFTLDQLFIKGGVARYSHKNTAPCVLWFTRYRCIRHYSIYRAKRMISGRIYHPIYDLHSHVVYLNFRPR